MTTKKLLTLICAWMVFALVATATAAPEKTISGTPGVATTRSIVNFSEIAREKPAQNLAPKLVHRPLIPEYKKKKQIPAAEEPQAKGGPQISSPAPSSSFQALADNGTSIPPDTHGAVGPNHVMTTLNTQVRIQNRSGAVLSTVSLNSFWSSLGNPDAFDPKVLYDPYAGRWISTAAANGEATNSAVLMGVSATSDPTGTWFLYKVLADASGVNWADYPSLGFNKNWIVVSINMFPIVGSADTQENIYAFNKTNLYAHGAGTFTLLQDIPGDGFTMVPSITYDTNLATEYLIESWSSGGGQLRVSTITGAIGSEVLTPGTSFPSSSAWNFGGNGDFEPQLGITRKIDGGDGRIQNVVYRNGKLWTTHTVFLPSSTPTRTAVQWWQINTNGSVLQKGQIDGASSNVFYAYPTIAVNKNNDALIGYSRFSSNQYASANYSFRFSTDSANTLRDDTVLKTGESPYFKTFGGADNRWGDYSSTVVDPVNDSSFWTVQEYAATASGDPSVNGSGRWGTWWGRIDVPLNIVLDSFTLAAETCAPTNGVIDSGEMVTVNFALKNLGGADATNVTVTLLASSSILSPSGTQNYGTLVASGTNVSRSFSFTANGTCGSNISAVLSIQVAGTNSSTITNTFQLGKSLVPLAENFDGVAAPALPVGWTATFTGTTTAWRTSTSSSDTALNSAFASDPGSVSDNRLTSPTFAIASTNAQLTFRHKYDLESSYDGGVLEISIDGGAFGDILSAGSFISGGYNQTINASFQNPLASRSAWSGNSGNFITTIAKLPVSAAGHQVQLRWRCGTDNDVSATGWYVDSISLSDGFSCCSSLVTPTIVNVTRNGTNINFSFVSVAGQSYTVEFKDSLSISNWTTLQSISGNGATKIITNSLSASTQRFYRVKSP